MIDTDIALNKHDLGIRNNILGFEEKLKKLPGALVGDNKMCPLKHTFAEEQYVREIFAPKGSLIVTKIHKKSHPVFILTGDCSVLTEEGVKRIKAPFHMITPAGCKRVVYVHEDTRWVTVHVTKEMDLDKIEEEVIAKTFDDLPNDVIDVEFEEVITKFIEEVTMEVKS